MSVFSPPKIDYLLVKVAARCNIDCSYCYWFSDPSVYRKPKLMSAEVADKLVDRIAEQVVGYGLTRFSLLFHGGEPMLWGIRRMTDFITRMRERVSVPITYAMTTNGVLLDEAWVEFVREHDIGVTVSLDGPMAIHDARRKDFKGNGTFKAAVAGYRLLRSRGCKVSALAVCDPSSDPEEVCRFFVDELKASSFDVLIPEANYEQPPPVSIAPYYTKLFDLWFDRYAPQGVAIRYPRALAIAAFGGDTHLESIGYGAQQTSTILTDGSMEPLDVLRYAGDSHTATSLSIFTHPLQAVVDEKLWREVFNNSLNFPDSCRPCPYRDACGGGYAPHRYSKERRYDNPSVYCSDYKTIIGHVFERLNRELRVEIDGVSVKPETLAQAPIKSIARTTNE